MKNRYDNKKYLCRVPLRIAVNILIFLEIILTGF